ncbi:hypothetical protein T07_12568 [Trichinella nelsoni]|uniref:Uncharacterized protein n=1 Tax=Trichinella nelsoni TaxID=6336 RepID=A0A0V0RKI9_9BILA|nr:hypothetical protein T07_12568 [Trichinella nelsoni]
MCTWPAFVIIIIIIITANLNSPLASVLFCSVLFCSVLFCSVPQLFARHDQPARSSHRLNDAVFNIT